MKTPARHGYLAANEALPASVLVVDDTPENLHLLTGLLRERRVNVRAASSGKAALLAVAKQPPDLILLDARMPELDGYEVCRQLKAQAQSSSIPVIFISALQETGDKVKAFEAGGLDFVTKPFHIEEIMARVGAHLQIRRLQQALAHQNEELEALVARRTKQLRDANAQLSVLSEAKSDFLNLISHELRTPLNGMLGAAELALAGIAGTAGAAALHQMYADSRQRLLALVDNALLLSQIQVQGNQVGRNTSNLDDVLQSAWESAGHFARLNGVTIGPPLGLGLGVVVGDWVFLEKMLLCLLNTAAKFASPGSEVALQGWAFTDQVCLSIQARGCSIPEECLPSFFEVLAIGETQTPGGDLGLAPSVAHRIITLLGGRVEVRNIRPGIEFHVWLPRSPSQHDGTGNPAVPPENNL